MYTILSPGIAGLTPDLSAVNGAFGDEDETFIVTYTETSSGDAVDLEDCKVTGVSDDSSKEYTESEVKNIGLEGLTEGVDYEKVITTESDKDGLKWWIVEFKPKSGKTKGSRKKMKLRVKTSQESSDHAPKNVKVRLMGEEAGSDGTKYVVTEVSWDEDKDVGVCEMRPFVADENGGAYEYLIKEDGQSIAREDDPSEVPEGFRYKVENGRNKFRMKVKKRKTGDAKTYTDSQSRQLSSGVGDGEELLVFVQSNVGGKLSDLYDGGPVVTKITDDNIKNKKVFTEEKGETADECDHNYTWIKMDDTFHEFKCSKCGDVHTTALHAFRKVQSADGNGTDYICMICNYKFVEEEELKPEEKPIIKEVEWKSIEEGFDVSFVTLLKPFTTAEGVIGTLIVWGGDEASGEPIAEGDIKKEDCAVEESTETTVTLKAPVKDTIWNVLLEELNKMDKVTVALKQKQEKLTETGEKKTEDVLSEPVTVEKGKKKTQVEIQEECSHDQAYGRVYVSLDNEHHSRRCGKCLKELSVDFHGSRKYVPENDKTHAWVCKQCGGVINSGIPHDITTEPCVNEAGDCTGYYTEKCDTCGWQGDMEIECKHPADKRTYYKVDQNVHDDICTQCGDIVKENQPHELEVVTKDAGQHTYTCKKCGETWDEDHAWGERMFTQIRSVGLGLARDFKYREKCSICGAYRTGWIRGIISFPWTRYYFDHEQLELAILEGKTPDSWKNRSPAGEFSLNAFLQTTSVLGILVPGMKLGERYMDLDGRKVSLIAAGSTQFSGTVNEGGYYGKGMDFKVFDKSGNEITNKSSKDKINNVQGLDALLGDGDADTGEWLSDDCFVDVSDVDGFIIAFNGETLKSVEDGTYTIELVEVLEDPEDPTAEPVAVILPMSYTVTTVNGEKCVTPIHPADTLVDTSGKTYEVNIDSSEYTYTGETITPTVTVAGSDGTEFKEGTDYTLSYYKFSENNGETVLTPIDKSAVKDTGAYRVVVTGISDTWAGSGYTDFTVVNQMTASIAPVTLKQGENTEPVISLGEGYFVTNVTYADAAEAKKATAAGITVMTTGTDRDGVLCEVHVSVDDCAYVGTTEIKLHVEGESIDGKAGSATVTASVTVEKGTEIIEPEASAWNLFEDDCIHEYAIGGVIAKKKLNNSNKTSAAYFDATLYKGKITVALKSGADRKKAATANTFDFDLGELGSVSYTLPITYNMPVLKLSSSKGTVKKGKATNLNTTVLVQTENGNYVPFDLTRAEIYYGQPAAPGAPAVTADANGQVTIPVSAKSSGKLVINKDGWNEKISLAYTVTETKSGADVLAVDLGGLKQVTLNTNAPEQTFDFPITLNGEPVTSDMVTITSSKPGTEALASVGEGILSVSLGRSGIGKGNYTLTFKQNEGSAKATVKVKVSDKVISATGKVKQKYDIVTGQPMVVIPTLKEVGGEITDVSVAAAPGAIYTDFEAVMDGGNINVYYTGTKAIDVKNMKIGDLKFSITVEGIDAPVEFTLKNVTAKKTTPKVKASKVTIPKSALEKADGSTVIATANILSSYVDSAKHTQTITPADVKLVPKNVEAVRDESDYSRILIKKLTGKSGSIKATLTYGGGVTKTVTIKVAQGK